MTDQQSGHSEEKTKKKDEKWFRSPPFRCALLFILTFLILFGIYFSVFTPRKYDFKVGSISHETINATKDVVDEVSTEEKRQAAANAIEPTYHFQADVKEEVLASLKDVFGELRTVQQYGLTLQSDDSETLRRTYTDEEIDYAIGIVKSVQLSRYQITTLLRTETAAFEDMVSTVTTAVENSLNATIREGYVSQSIQNIMQIVGYKVDVSLTQTILPTVLRTCIKPNMTIDQEATDAAKAKVMEGIDPIVYLQGQNIIREGDRITKSQLEMLRSLGMLNSEKYDHTIYIGALLCILLALTCLFFSLYMLMKPVLQDIRRMMVIMLVLIISVAFAAIAHLLPSIYITPVSLAAILITVLIHYRAGIAVTIPMALLISGLTFGNSITTMYDNVLLLTMTLSESVATVWFLKGHPQRLRVLLAGPISAIPGIVLIMTIRLLTAAESLNISNTILWSVGGSLLSGALATALQPVFENLFRLPTPSKLLELTNPNQPLMRRLLIEAAGTYHHSIIVANLAEAAATRIGANPYLARAGAYYHDIGKLKRPLYFKENQMGDNPHDKTDPYVSAAILTSHPKDGVFIAQKEKIPVEVQDIIRQHHGVTPVMFFYHKALQMSNGNQVDINEFRYEGPRPQTKEAAIVMLADTIEAAVRSMKDPTPKAIDQFIERLVRGRVEDGQLSDSPLTLDDIDNICDAFSKILKGVFHERIEYPTVKHSIQMPPQTSPSPVSGGETQESAARPEQGPAVPEEEKAIPEEFSQPAGKTAETESFSDDAENLNAAGDVTEK